MSLILDALKRAERERREILTPFANPDPSALTPTPRRRFGFWKVVGIFLVLLVAGLSTWIFIQRHRSPAVKHPVVVKPAPMPAKPVPKPAPDAMPALAPAVIPGTEGTASLDELTEPTPSAAAAPFPPASPPPAAPSNAGPSTTAPPAPTETPANASESRPMPVPATPDDIPVAKAPAALTQPAPLRRFREMPPAFRADFPALTVQVHVYESSPDKRWVLINDRRYKEGDRLAEGPGIIEIARDGIVMEFRGERLLYTLGR